MAVQNLVLVTVYHAKSVSPKLFSGACPTSSNMSLDVEK